MKSVLVVDDDAFHLEMASDLLGKLGVKQIQTAESGGAAKRLLTAAGGVDLLMLDLNMPDCDGVEFLEDLTQIKFGAALVIVTSTNAAVRNGAATLAQAYGLNVAGVVQKPLTLQKLVAVLAHA